MIRLALGALLVLGAAAPQNGGPVFVAYDVYIDPGDAALAAWQFEIVPGPGAKVVGIENGDGAFSAEAPFYDPRALQGGRIVVAAFTTEEVKPGRIRVATLHMQESAVGEVDYASKVMAAAEPGADKIDAKIELVRKGRTK